MTTLQCIVSVLHRNEGGIGKSIPYGRSIFLQGVDQEILPSGQGRIDVLKSTFPS